MSTTRAANMDFGFQPLELWRASNLAQETKSVIAAYERCLASNDMEGLTQLRSAIESRIDELDAFYTAHVDDERSILFDKQRLKLRKLLHEYDGAVRSVSAAAPAQLAQQAQLQTQQYMYSPSLSQVEMGGHTDAPRHLREDAKQGSRLSMAELLSWFTQAGSAEMPEVTVPVVENLFTNVTRTNVDGKMSIRDLRQWYISYGKRALRSGVSSFNTEVVPTALVKHGKDRDALGGGRRRGSRDQSRPLYQWEQSEGGGGVGGFGSSSSLPSPSLASTPLALPNHMLEFQIRLSSEEYASFASRMRQYQAELRYKDRIAKGQQARVAAGE